MKPLTANMKIFYQRKMMYMWYFILLSQLPGLIMLTKTPNLSLFQPLLLPMLVGIVVAGMLKDVFVCPVTFCLPGQKPIPAKIFNIGSVIAPLILLITVKFMPDFSDNPLFGSALPLTALVSMQLAMYYLCATMIYMSDYVGKVGFFGNMGIVTPSRASGSLLSRLIGIKPTGMANLAFPFIVLTVLFAGNYISDFTVDRPVSVVIFSIVMIFYSISKISGESRRRSLCGKNIISNVQGWNPQQNAGMFLADFADRARAGDRIAFSEKLFTALSSRVRTTFGRLSLGYLYNMTDCIGIRFWQTMISPLLVLLIWGYIYGNIPARNDAIDPGNTVMCMVYIFPAIGALLWALPMHSGLHIPAGRKNKFAATLLATIGLTIIGTFFVWAAVVIAKLAAPYMPPVRLFQFAGSGEFHFATPDLSYLWITPATMPVGFAFGALFGRGGLVRMMIVPFIIILEEFAVTFLTFKVGPLLSIPIGIIGIGWLFYILSLHRLCFKKSLAGPGRD